MLCELYSGKARKIVNKGRGKGEGKARRPEGWEHYKNDRRRVEEGEERIKGDEQANEEDLQIK